MAKFSIIEDQFIIDNYLDMYIIDIAVRLGRYDSVVSLRMKQLGLVVPASILATRRGARRKYHGANSQTKPNVKTVTQPTASTTFDHQLYAAAKYMSAL